MAADASGNIWITNGGGNSVTELPAGNPTNPTVYSGSSYGFNRPEGVAADASGNIWITNVWEQRDGAPARDRCP